MRQNTALVRVLVFGVRPDFFETTSQITKIDKIPELSTVTKANLMSAQKIMTRLLDYLFCVMDLGLTAVCIGPCRITVWANVMT